MANRRLSKTSRSFPVRESGLAAARLGRAALEAAGCFILDPECRISYVSSVATVLVRGGMESSVRAELARLSVVVGPSVPLWDGKEPVVCKEAINAEYSSLVRFSRTKGIPSARARELARRSVDNKLALIHEAHALRGYAVVALPVRSGLREAISAVGCIPGVVGVEQREIGSGSSDSQSHINPNMPRPVGLKRTGFHDSAAVAADRKANPVGKARKAPAPSADNSAAAKELVDRIKDPNLSPSGLLWPDRVTGLPNVSEEPGFRHADGYLSPVGAAAPLVKGDAPHALLNLVRFVHDNLDGLSACRAECASWTIDL